MFNLANCRLYRSCSQGRCFKRLGAKAQIIRGEQVRLPYGLRFVPRKRHTRDESLFPQTKILNQVEVLYEYPRQKVEDENAQVRLGEGAASEQSAFPPLNRKKS